MAIPRDAHYVPGSRRVYVQLSNGDIVSRQTAENMYAQQTGFSSDYSRRRAFRFLDRKSNHYKQGLESARENGISKRDFDNLAAHVAADYAANKADMDKSPDGPLANYLVAIGRRQDTDRWFVGDSPSVL
jgi:hypothetical protein